MEVASGRRIPLRHQQLPEPGGVERHGPVKCRQLPASKGPLPSKRTESIQVNRVAMGGLACGLALLLTTACTSSSTLPTSGPFGSTIPNSGMICAHTRPGGTAYSGFEDFPNRGEIGRASCRERV